MPEQHPSGRDGAFFFQSDVRHLVNVTKDNPNVIQRDDGNIVEFGEQEVPPELIVDLLPPPIPGSPQDYKTIATMREKIGGMYIPCTSLTFQRSERTRKRYRESIITYASSGMPPWLGRLALCVGSYQTTDVSGTTNPQAVEADIFQRMIYNTVVENSPATPQVAELLQFETEFETNGVTDMEERLLLQNYMRRLAESHGSKQDGA